MNADCEFRIADYQKDRVTHTMKAIKKPMPASPNEKRIIQIASFLKVNLSIYHLARKRAPPGVAFAWALR